jgi:hypothetical protein
MQGLSDPTLRIAHFTTAGRAALRDSKPAYVGSGSNPEFTFRALRSASAGCGHTVYQVYVRDVP